MKHQYDKAYRPIPIYGCYFCSIGKAAEEKAGVELTDEQVMAVYARALSDPQKPMAYDTFMRRPAVIGNLFLEELGSSWRLHMVGWWNTDTGEDLWGSGNINLVVNRFSYGKGNHFCLPEWDPHPGLNLGPLTGKRYFHFRRGS